VSGTALLVIVAGVAVVAWWAELQRHPIRQCPSCKGSKKNTGSISSLRWGTCRRCGGTGETRRFGAAKK
jgi:DnaJ-class molecular chaperone